MGAIDVFHPSRMADRILGMGDVVSLVERAQEQFDEEEARKIQKKIAKNQFGFDDFLSQIQQVKKRSEEHTSELQSRPHLVCRLLLEKKNLVHRLELIG